jgi:hypothetical protein
MSYTSERAAKRLERDQKMLARALANPITLGQSISRENLLRENIASTAIAIEALETLLVRRGILADNEVLDTMKELMDAKKAQVEAANATEPEPSRIISSV